MTDERDEGQAAPEQAAVAEPNPMPLDEIFRREKLPEEPNATAEPASSAAAEPAPADPPRVSPAEPAGAGAAPEPAPVPAPAPEPAPQPAPVAQAQPLLTPEFMAQAWAHFQQMQGQRPQAEEPPDPDIDPRGAFEYHQRRADAARERDRLNMSHDLALETIPDYVQVMGANNANWDAYLAANPHVWEHVRTSRHPAKAAYELLKREQEIQTIREAGGIEGFRKKAVEDFFAAYGPNAQQPSGQPALAVVPGAGAQPAAPAIPEPMGDDRSAAPRGPARPAEMPLEQIHDKRRFMR